MIRKMDVVGAAASVMLLFGVGAVCAHADTFVYTFQPTTGGGDGFSFKTSSNPTVLTANSTSFLGLVSGSADGVGLEHSLATFFTSGGLDFIGDCDISIPVICSYDFTEGVNQRPALFTGSTSSPTLLTGSFEEAFHFTKTTNGISGPPVAEEGFLTITDVTPEPSSLMLLATGLLGFLGVSRRRTLGR